MLRTLLLGFFALVASAAMLEGLASLWLWFRRPPDGAVEHRPIAVDPAVGYGYDRRDYRDSPNTSGSVGPSRFCSWRRYGSTTSAGGDRGLSILALGGSTTDPILQVKYSGIDGTWPHLLGERLAAEGRPSEISNAGMVGNLAAQELVRLIAILPESRADVVISLNGINELYFADRDWYRDPDNRCAAKFLLSAFDEIPSGGRLFHGDLRLASTSLLHWIRGTSIEATVRELRHGRKDREGEASSIGSGDRVRLESLRTACELSAERRSRLESAADAWLLHVRLMNAICRELDARYIVVLQPAMGVNMSRDELFTAFMASADAGRPDAVLHALLARKGYLESVSYLYTLLRDRGRSLEAFHDTSLPGVLPDSQEFYHSPRYPNAKGNARIADTVLKLLL